MNPTDRTHFETSLRTFASGCTYCNPIPRFEKFSLGYRVVNLGFEDVEEAISTDLLSSFWSFKHSFCFFTQGTKFGGHCTRFATSKVTPGRRNFVMNLDQRTKAGPSVNDHSSLFERDTDQDEVSDDGEHEDDGMDRGGFIGDETLKPLTPEALAAFRAAQDRAGVIYISRIPPGMQPPKVRHLMSAYGEIGRVYLQQEGKRFIMCQDL